MDPSFAYAYTLLGHEYSLIGELDKSLKLFKDAVYADNRHYHAWYRIMKYVLIMLRNVISSKLLWSTSIMVIIGMVWV